MTSCAHRPSPAHLAAPVAVELVVACAVGALAPHPLAVASLLLVAIAASGAAYARSRRFPQHLRLDDDGLSIDGERFVMATAWLATGWVVMRGRRNGRRARLAVHRGDVDAVFFARLRRHVIAALPRVHAFARALNRPRAAARRAGR